MKTSMNIAELRNIAASQWGMFSSAQALNVGIGRTQLSRMVDDGRLENITYGIYRFTSGEISPFSDIKAAWMSISPKEFAYERTKKDPPDAVVAGQTASVLHRAGDLYPTPFTFIVPKRRQTTRSDMHFLTWSIEREDIVTVEGMPVTTPERTIADLIRLKEDPSLIDDFIKDLDRNGTLIDSVRLEKLLSPLAARNGYRRNDGQSYVKGLLEKNVAYPELIHASSAMKHANSTVNETARKMQDAIKPLIATMMANSALQDALNKAASTIPQFTPAAAEAIKAMAQPALSSKAMEDLRAIPTPALPPDAANSIQQALSQPLLSAEMLKTFQNATMPTLPPELLASIHDQIENAISPMQEASAKIADMQKPVLDTLGSIQTEAQQIDAENTDKEKNEV